MPLSADALSSSGATGAAAGKKPTGAYSIRAVNRALDVLELIVKEVDAVGIFDVSRRLGLTRNNACRLLATLEFRAFVQYSENSAGYRLGYKGLLLGRAAARQMDILRQAKPVLQSLVGRCGETADVAVLKGMEIIHLDVVESGHPLRVMPRTGAVTPLHCTATGKALLAWTAAAEQERCLARMHFERYTATTITCRHRFCAHLKLVAAQGYAIEDEEREVGVKGIAAPVRDFRGGIVGAVSVSGPAPRFGPSRMNDDLIPLVLHAAAELSRRLGYIPPSSEAAGTGMSAGKPAPKVPQPVRQARRKISAGGGPPW